ncbi:Cof-type HAD-IIB family hydrolase [Paenibacillus lentus]|uniref:HAD family phosphatase n=1 Tax=Paenibacillus lentus TaxID=1338368 RepID=A0A3S8RZN8_9BACL|nr:Cof-type HAD-IIB family hydrolase [Paenibacillus lentus]AZK48329.1 HAD family phosphatase [Paenibacillus lentus]
MKLIAIDLDGTLLTAESKPSIEGLQAIRDILSVNDHEVTICTGRARFDVLGIIGEDIPIPIISANGAAVHDERGQLLQESPIPHTIAAEAINYLIAQDVYFEIFCPEEIYTPFEGISKVQAEMDILISANPGIDIDTLQRGIQTQMQQFGIKQINDPREVLRAETPIYKLLIFTYDGEKLNRITEHFQNQQSVQTTAAANHTLEIISTKTDKGSALQFLASYYNIDMADTIAIGDNYNDISMFQAAGTSVAMGNAVDEIKQLSSLTTRSNNEHGVAYALNTLLSL